MKKSVLKFLSTMGLVCCASSALAGGYQLNEYSVTGLGRSFAGVGVVGDDYSALAYNPAGMSLMQSGMQAGVSIVQLKADVKNEIDPSDSPGTIRLYSPIPSVFAQYKLNDRWDFGLGVYMPYGLATKYKKDWFGSDFGIKSELIMIDMAPALSYKAAKQLTVGGTFIVRYIKGNMTNTMPLWPGLNGPTPNSKSEFDLDGWTVAGILGVMYEPVKDARVGLSWRSKSTQQVKGTHTISNYNILFNQEGTGKASPDLPETWTLSGFYKPVDKIGLSSTVRWTRWSKSFPDFTLESDTRFFQNILGGAKTQEYDWQDSWTIVGGVDYYMNKNWTLRCGGGWDQSPTHGKDIRATARIPDNNRIWASLGFSYILDSMQLDVGYAHMFMKTTHVQETSVSEKLDAKYDSQGNILGVQMQYKF